MLARSIRWLLFVLCFLRQFVVGFRNLTRIELLFDRVLPQEWSRYEGVHLDIPKDLVSNRAATNEATNVFQLYKPVTTPSGATQIQYMLLMNHSFGNSYGAPYVGSYDPPTPPFTNVHINLTVTSKGRQFDRLAIMYLGDIEVFRTSTAEPTADSIIWTYSKDMTQYLSLWRTHQKIIFDLGNLINHVYTASFNVTLVATFFNTNNPPEPLAAILPISAKKSGRNSSSAFSLPSDKAASTHKIPAGYSRAIVSLSACGQGAEEFWYSNVPSYLTSTFANTTGELYGYSSFREVQLLIDGMLAGVAYPFPIIFTGGIAPGFWRPEVGIDAFDLREPEIDITPFLPYLEDGEEHSFEIKVVGLTNSSAFYSCLTSRVADYWVVTGKVFLFTDQSTKNPPIGVVQTPMTQAAATTYHSPPTIFDPDPFIWMIPHVTQDSNHTNTTLRADVSFSRRLVVTSPRGTWEQVVVYGAMNYLTDQGLYQRTVADALGWNRANYKSTSNSANGDKDWSRATYVEKDNGWATAFFYPLDVSTNITIFGKNPNADAGQGIGIDASLSRSLQIETGGTRRDVSPYTLNPWGRDEVFELWMWQAGQARYSSQTNRSYSFGRTEEWFKERSRGEGEFVQEIGVRNGSVNDRIGGGVEDQELWKWIRDDMSRGSKEKSEERNRTHDTGGKELARKLLQRLDARLHTSEGQEHSTQPDDRMWSQEDMRDSDVRQKIGKGLRRPGGLFR